MADIRLFEKDPYAPIRYVYEIDQVLYRGKSAFQEFAVVTNPYFGRMLVLDGVVQFTERDEFYYHEMMAHVALHAMESPRTVVVIGGGDGGVIREVLKHPTVEKAYLVDIDTEVSRVSREFFPTVGSALSDPRLVDSPMDGAAFLDGFDGTADAVLVDSTDIVGHARSLFTPEFYESARRVLGDRGLFVTLSESLHFHLPMVREVQKTLKKAFKTADLYTAPLATYAGNWWCFAVGSNGADIRKPARKPVTPTRYYCAEVHQTCFLPRFLYDRVMEEGRESL
ncbi:MAG: polyamine aminopropyltransferase [Deltaproteobacteria bacterium]|nr:polyamine aminopropyltransferase [Deltaproteobacteria bacterium]